MHDILTTRANVYCKFAKFQSPHYKVSTTHCICYNYVKIANIPPLIITGSSLPSYFNMSHALPHATWRGAS